MGQRTRGRQEQYPRKGNFVRSFVRNTRWHNSISFPIISKKKPTSHVECHVDHDGWDVDHDACHVGKGGCDDAALTGSSDAVLAGSDDNISENEEGAEDEESEDEKPGNETAVGNRTPNEKPSNGFAEASVRHTMAELVAIRRYTINTHTFSVSKKRPGARVCSGNA